MPLRNPDITNASLTGDLLAAGEYVPRRDLWGATAPTLTAGTIHLTYFTARLTETVSTLTTRTGSTAAAATPTLCKVGVYSVAANGDLTLVGVSANDTAMWATGNTAYASALVASFLKVAGQRYATAALCVTGAATPTLLGQGILSSVSTNAVMLDAPTLIGRFPAQTDMVTPIAVASVAGGNNRFGMKLS
jgi:hypothetical protein